MLKLEHIIETGTIIAGKVMKVDSTNGMVTLHVVTSGEKIDLPYSMLYFIRPNDPATEYRLPE